MYKYNTLNGNASDRWQGTFDGTEIITLCYGSWEKSHQIKFNLN